jgi:predicted ATP-dependent serine protease
MAMSGEAGAGKSSFALKLTAILCTPNLKIKGGDKALYLNIEEPRKRGATIQSKCRNMKLSTQALRNIDIVEDEGASNVQEFEALANAKEYKYIIIDSVSMMCGVSINKHIELWNWIQTRPESFILILHYTKSKLGKMQGPTLWEHNPDVVVWVANNGEDSSTAEFKKNRYLTQPKRKFNTYTERIV